MTSLYGPSIGGRNHFDEEIHRGLPQPDFVPSLATHLFDEPAGERKYNKSVTFQMDETMWQALQDIIANKNLPFDGHMATALRHALGMTIEALDKHVTENRRTLFREMMNQQARLTRERIIVTVDDLIDKQVENLRFWTSKSNWRMVVRDLSIFQNEVKEYPERAWREHTAQVWLRHGGVKALGKFWEERMKDESLDSWRSVIAVQKKWEDMAGE
jgi:hypothetical protein